MAGPESCNGRYELHLAAMPVLPGAGTRLLDQPDLERLRLEQLGAEEIARRTALRFRGHRLALGRAACMDRFGPC
jgi:hypothetical protein